MYNVYGDGICIYSDMCPDESVNAASPSLAMKVNTAGSLEITLPVGNVGYDSINRFTSEIVVKRDNEEIWSGRIISEKKNFRNSRILTCEGELAYLNDTIQPQKQYTDSSEETALYNFLSDILTIHNLKVMGIYDEDSNDADAENGADVSAYEHTGYDKRFFVGGVTVTVDDDFSWVTDNELTMNILSDIVDKYGGYLRIRKVVNNNGVTVRYLDYLKDYIGTTDMQEIRFGRNLIDFTRNWDLSELVTVVIPQGESQGSSDEVDGVNTYLTVKNAETYSQNDITHKEGSIYVTNDAAIETYGRIERILSFDDISDADTLLTKSVEYLKDGQFDNVTIEVSAVDLRYLSKNVRSIGLLEEVRCVSSPHGMDRIFPVTELNIQLDSPENSTYVLSSKVSACVSTKSSSNLSGIVSSDYSSVMSGLNNAKAAAISVINSATRGYVTITKSKGYSEAICISDTPANAAYTASSDTWAQDTKLWRWSMGGLAFFENGYRPSDVDNDPNKVRVAITMDGKINADFIALGELSAINIHSAAKDGEDYVSEWNLNTGIFKMTKGSISLGKTPNGAYAYRFSVNDEGELYSECGKIGGFTITADEIYNSTMSLSADGLDFYFGTGDNRSKLGSYITNDWNESDAKGLSVNLDPKGSYISWGAKNDDADDTYEVKLMYVGKNAETMLDDDGEAFTKDRLHLGTPLIVTRNGFEYEYNRTTYNSVTLRSSSGRPIPIQFAYNVKLNNDGTINSYEFNKAPFYICNGLIMMK